MTNEPCYRVKRALVKAAAKQLSVFHREFIPGNHLLDLVDTERVTISD